MKKNLCFLRQSGSSHAHRSFIDQSTAGLALCGFWRYPYRLSTRLSRPFVGNPAFIHKLPKASPPPVDRTSGQFLSNSRKARPTGLSALYKQALHIDLNRNWGKFPSAIASIVPATSERKNFVFFLKPLRPRRCFRLCAHFAPRLFYPQACMGPEGTIPVTVSSARFTRTVILCSQTAVFAQKPTSLRRARRGAARKRLRTRYSHSVPQCLWIGQVIPPLEWSRVDKGFRRLGRRQEGRSGSTFA